MKQVYTGLIVFLSIILLSSLLLVGCSTTPEPTTTQPSVTKDATAYAQVEPPTHREDFWINYVYRAR
jgi:PBP1b-binding outer membrane lipoprotein LpoB